jgi:hypothetical protein
VITHMLNQREVDAVSRTVPEMDEVGRRRMLAGLAHVPPRSRHRLSGAFHRSGCIFPRRELASARNSRRVPRWLHRRGARTAATVIWGTTLHKFEGAVLRLGRAIRVLPLLGVNT